MVTLDELTVRIGADADDLESGLGKAAQAVEDNIGKITAAGVAAGGSMEAFARGQADVNASLARTAIASGENEEALRASAYAMADHTGGAEAAADGMELLAQKGFDTKQEFEAILPAVGQFGDAVGKDLPSAISSADRLLVPFGDDLSDVGDNADQMSRLIQQTDIPLGTLERNLGRVPDELQALEFGLDDAAAGVEYFRDQGYSGQESVREFRRAVADSEGDMGEFLDVLGLTAEEWENYQTAVEPTPGLTQELADAANDTSTPLQDLQDRVQDLMFRYGGLADAAGSLALPLMALGPILKGATTVIQGATRAKNALSLAFLRSPVFWLVAGLALLAGAFWYAWQNSATFRETVTGLWGSLSSAAEPVINWLTTTALSAFQSLATWVGENEATMTRLAIAIVAIGAAVAAVVIGLKVYQGIMAVVRGLTLAWVGVQWLLNAAFLANPITWIVLGILALIAVIALVIVYWDEIVAATRAAWDWLMDILSSALDWIIDLFLNWTLIGLVIQYWDQIAAGFQAGVDAAVAFVVGLVTNVIAFIGRLAQLPGMVGDYFRGLYQRAQQQGQNLISFVQSIPSRITSALGNLGSLLRNAGRSVIQGLINGIKSMISNIGSTMSNVASTIRGYLPFSPAEVGPMSGDGAPEVSGARIAETLGEGVMSELTAIDRAADELMRPLDDRLGRTGDALGDVARSIPTNVNRAVREGGNPARVVVDVTGGDGELKRMIRKMVKVDGRGSVQTAFGRG
ncbi:phage tail tape measure protein [Nocardiopsis salina]|uniref:phage tail tape measure protein n=1 Tax=Nocardiopsis salina TaxID=245836 RepID=UPI0003458518|nr:phage tail tape measure protein [Nocardiopsis salina]